MNIRICREECSYWQNIREWGYEQLYTISLRWCSGILLRENYIIKSNYSL